MTGKAEGQSQAAAQIGDAVAGSLPILREHHQGSVGELGRWRIVLVCHVSY